MASSSRSSKLSLETRERRKSGRLTPYSFKSSNRGAGGRAPCGDSEATSNEASNEVFKNVLGKVCRLYTVSPLWQLKSTENALKEYAQELTGLLATLPQTTTRGQKRSSPYVGVVKGSKDSAGNYTMIEVKVVSRQPQRRSAPSLGPPAVCTAILCTTSQPQHRVTGFTYLPLLVVQGPVAISTTITDWLKTSFDCCITSCKLDQLTLWALAEKYTGKQKSSSRREKLGGIKLIYKCPVGVGKAGMNHISLELPYDSTLALSRTGAIVKTVEEVIHTHLSLKLSCLTLIGVSTPVLQALCNGSIKGFSLTEVILNRIQCDCPLLGGLFLWNALSLYRQCTQ